MKNLKSFLLCFMIIGSQNSVYAMDSSKPKINAATALKTVAATLTIASVYLHSQKNPMQSPVENSLQLFVNQPTVTMNNNQGYYYLRGSAAQFNCDDEGCTHKKLAQLNCPDDGCNC